MCGDIEEDTALDDMIFQRFAAFAPNHGAVPLKLNLAEPVATKESGR